MTGHPYASLGVVAIVLAYYLVAWFRFGRDPKQGVIVAQYEPPKDMSPAMLRYVWKQSLDERVFWAAVLSLVSKGLATLYSKDERTLLVPVEHVQPKERLPREEATLYDTLCTHSRRKPFVLSLVNDETQFVAEFVCTKVRKEAGERWFTSNLLYVQIGAMLSLCGVAFAAAPHTLEEYAALAIVLGLTAPATYYLFFLSMRTLELLRSLSKRNGIGLWKRLLGFLLLSASCVSAIGVGSLVLAFDFGMPVLIAALTLIGVNLIFLYLMRAPTAAGREVMDQIEGFREFLLSVEQPPMELYEGPSNSQGLYERYLPYAVALEVEQSWADHFVLKATTDAVSLVDARSKILDLGMWNGRVVEIAIGPPKDPYYRY
jgi:hypothetical protein